MDLDKLILEEFDPAFESQRIALRDQYEAKFRSVQAVTEVFRANIPNYASSGLHAHAVIANAAMYLNISHHDISVLVFQVAGERETWQRKLAARHLALATYESAEDMTKLLGGDFRDMLIALNLMGELDQDYRASKEPLDKFRDENSLELALIRNEAIGHRLRDACRLYDVIANIKVARILELGLKLGFIQNDVGTFIQKTMHRAATVHMRVQPRPARQHTRRRR